MGLLTWMPFTAGNYKSIKSDIVFLVGPTSYKCYIVKLHSEFIGEEGHTETIEQAKERCEHFYRKTYGLPENDAAMPGTRFVSTLEHHDHPKPGVKIYDSQYRMSRTMAWQGAELTWVSLLNSRISAPKPNLMYYLNDPDYDWYTDYQLDPQGMPSRPNGAI